MSDSIDDELEYDYGSEEDSGGSNQVTAPFLSGLLILELIEGQPLFLALLSLFRPRFTIYHGTLIQNLVSVDGRSVQSRGNLAKHLNLFQKHSFGFLQMEKGIFC